MGFRSRIFLAIFGVATAGLLSAATIVSVVLPRQTARRLSLLLESEARLIADDLIRHRGDLVPEEVDSEADRLHRLLASRVTMLASDGTVLGDSAASGEALADLDNHAGRPEVVQAMREGVGFASRRSDTLDTGVLYVAVRAEHPIVNVVRLAMPLSEVRSQIATIRAATLTALGIALAGAIAGLACCLIAGWTEPARQ